MWDYPVLHDANTSIVSFVAYSVLMPSLHGSGSGEELISVV